LSSGQLRLSETTDEKFSTIKTLKVESGVINMEFRIRSVALDFIVGGIIVAGALFVATLFGPVYGGILAGAPIRAGSTVFLDGLQHGTKSATELTRGVVLAMLANVGFSIVLYLTLPKFGLYKSFFAASAVFLALLVAILKVSS
jgi:hypothetical protein